MLFIYLLLISVFLIALCFYNLKKERINRTFLLKIISVIVILNCTVFYYQFLHKFQFKQDVNINPLLELNFENIKPERLSKVLDSITYPLEKDILVLEGINQYTHKVADDGIEQRFKLSYRRDITERIQITITQYNSKTQTSNAFNQVQNRIIKRYGIQEEKEQGENHYFISYILQERADPEGLYALMNKYNSYAVFKNGNILIEISAGSNSKLKDSMQDAINRLSEGLNKLELEKD